MSPNANPNAMKRFAFPFSRALFLAVPLLLFFSCKQEQGSGANTRHAVNPVLTADVPFRDFEIDVAAGDTIELEEGTRLYVPSNIFVDASGNPVTGKVQLHYRAFYTPGEIIASGITMLYDTAGEESPFSSAGMFELYGTQNDKAISIAPGKTIEMDFASTHNDADFSFYELDTVSAKWNFVTKGAPADTSLLYKKLQDLIAAFPRKPMEPKEYNPSKPVINLDMDLSDHPELSGYSDIIWQYAGNENDPDKNAWIYSTAWTSAKLQLVDSNTCTYNMNLSGSGKKFSSNVVPVLKGKNYAQAMTQFKEKMNAFNASEKERQEKRKTLAQTPLFMRRSSIRSFGICNWDIFQIFGNPELLFSVFHFDDPEMEKNRDNVTVFVVTADGRIISYYNGAAEPKITYIPEKNNCIIAVLNGTAKGAILSNNEFNEMAKAENGKAARFQLHSTSHPVANSKDLDDLISKL